MRPHLAERVMLATEWVAGALLAFVAALTFVAVALRYILGWSIPDAYDLSRNFLGILIFWGIAVTSFRAEHITVDLVWTQLPPRGRRGLDLLGTLFTLACMGAFAWAMLQKVLDERASGEETYDLHLRVWPFYAIAWIGLAVSVLLLLVRLARQMRAPLTVSH
ncbi:MAG TPA: TRAP transporter small permease subunit [Acetobacteraceae bacterium]|nr:TRAP transporter small permease subunit [Acetobacteraceae bacterium]